MTTKSSWQKLSLSQPHSLSLASQGKCGKVDRKICIHSAWPQVGCGRASKVYLNFGLRRNREPAKPSVCFAPAVLETSLSMSWPKAGGGGECVVSSPEWKGHERGTREPGLSIPKRPASSFILRLFCLLESSRIHHLIACALYRYFHKLRSDTTDQIPHYPSPLNPLKSPFSCLNSPRDYSLYENLEFPSTS